MNKECNYLSSFSLIDGGVVKENKKEFPTYTDFI